MVVSRKHDKCLGKSIFVGELTRIMMLLFNKELKRHRSCHSEEDKMREDLNSLIRRTRIVSGLVLFVYASTHLLNHSVAAISIAAADAAREYFIAVWRNPVAEIRCSVTCASFFWDFWRQRGRYFR